MNNAGKAMVCLKGPSVHFPAGNQENKYYVSLTVHSCVIA